MINFKTIPFLKILIPYLLGVFFTIKVGYIQNLHVFFLSAFLLFVCSFLIQKFFNSKSWIKKWLYIFSADLLLFFLANESCFLYNAKNNVRHYTHHIEQKEQRFIGIIDDLPVVTDKFIKLSVQLNSIESNNNWFFTMGNMVVYVKKDSTLKFTIGNTVFINSKFGYINEPKNPNEFNYKEFLERKNIYNTVYAKPEQICVLKDFKQSFSLIQFGAKIKAHVVSILRNCGLSQQAFSICTALLVGYDDEIDKDIMQSFSHSGTLHILSVSGMHTGLLYGLIISIFLFFDKHDKRKKSKCLVVILSLILFVIITGFSPSVLRAALMLSLVSIGNAFYKQGNSYNTLLVSAFVLLLFDPYLIEDASFLLSYFAVFGIMYLYPILHRLYIFENKIGQWFWNLILMSVAATVFTLPISLYFFHQFPIWFAFSNLIIIPISIFLMGATVILIFCYKITVLKMFFAFLINGSTSIMLWVSQLTDNSSYGFLDFISFSKMDALFCSLFLITLFVFIYAKKYTQLLIVGVVLITWITISIGVNFNQLKQNELVVFSVKNKSAIVLRIGKHFYSDTNGLSSSEFNRFVKPYFLNFSNPLINTLIGNYIRVNSTAIMFYNSPSMTAFSHNAKYIIVSNNTPLTFNNLTKAKPIIIADCSNNYNFVKELKKQCESEGAYFYSVKEKGAFTIKF